MRPPIHLGILMAGPLDRHDRVATRAPVRRSEPAVTVRRLPATAPEVARLALLDGYGAPMGDWLVAEVAWDGRRRRAALRRRPAPRPVRLRCRARS